MATEYAPTSHHGLQVRPERELLSCGCERKGEGGERRLGGRENKSGREEKNGESYEWVVRWRKAEWGGSKPEEGDVDVSGR